jgi:hypothetical protein
VLDRFEEGALKGVDEGSQVPYLKSTFDGGFQDRTRVVRGRHSHFESVASGGDDEPPLFERDFERIDVCTDAHFVDPATLVNEGTELPGVSNLTLCEDHDLVASSLYIREYMRG